MWQNGEELEQSGKGLSMRQKLQNSKGYAESPEFLPALGLFRRILSLQKFIGYV